MIYIGVTGWGDHHTLYPDGTKPGEKLHVYSGHFPVVEVDSSFYAIQPERNFERWVKETPETFKFVVKAYQGLTGHQRSPDSFTSLAEMFSAFRASIEPLLAADRLLNVLFQYPPWFDCKKEHVDMLRYTKLKMDGIPVALEFRNQTWFEPKWRASTLDFMREEGWIHTICDEPQAGIGSVPVVMEVTHPQQTMIRFHGRNTYGWTAKGPNWRDVRYLYRYNRNELLEWKEQILQLVPQSEHLVILFNNNSGGDAADNAKQLIQLLGIEYTGLAPKQLDLFDL
jgi:uncharacterized protein YecE (DUF72 family)